MSQTKDVIIILGGGINPDGSLQEFVRARVRKGVELYQRDAAEYFIMCGFYSLAIDYVPAITEARAMRDYAVSLGIGREKIILEEKSRDTVGNIYFTKKILERRGWCDLIVITSKFHRARVGFLLKKILGPKYKINLITTDNYLVENKQHWILAKEKKMLSFSHRWFGCIPAGWDWLFGVFLLAEYFFLLFFKQRIIRFLYK